MPFCLRLCKSKHLWLEGECLLNWYWLRFKPLWFLEGRLLNFVYLLPFEMSLKCRMILSQHLSYLLLNDLPLCVHLFITSVREDSLCCMFVNYNVLIWFTFFIYIYSFGIWILTKETYSSCNVYVLSVCLAPGELNPWLWCCKHHVLPVTTGINITIQIYRFI